MTISIPRSLKRVILPEMLTHMVFMDTETTGLQITGNQDDMNNNANSILEVSFVRTHNLSIVEKLHLYIDFQGDIPAESTKVHGISNADMELMRENAKKYQHLLDGSPSIEQIKELSRITDAVSRDKAPAVPWRKAANTILSFTSPIRNGGATICAHSLSFDAKWINFMMRRSILEAFKGDGKSTEEIDHIAGKQAILLSNRRRSLDSLQCANLFWPSSKISLDACADRLNIDRSARAEFHGALIDTLLLLDVFRGIMGIEPITFGKTN